MIDNKDTKKEQGVTQSHHILQRAYFKLIDKNCDNSKNNLINLKYSDHILAHYYLCYCTRDKIKQSNYYAFNMMVNIPSKDFDLDLFRKQQYVDYDNWYKEYCKNNSGKNNPMYGKHHTEETKQKISKALSENNFMYGKHHTKEVKQKISKAMKGKNSGIHNGCYGFVW